MSLSYTILACMAKSRESSLKCLLLFVTGFEKTEHLAQNNNYSYDR